MEHKSERYSKDFKDWDQFIAILFTSLLRLKATEKPVADLPTAYPEKSKAIKYKGML